VIKEGYTKRYEEYIDEKVKESTVEQVSHNEQLSTEQVKGIFSKMANRKKRLVIARKTKFR
jgi:Helix-turn-helix domain of transposase family ISL3